MALENVINSNGLNCPQKFKFDSVQLPLEMTYVQLMLPLGRLINSFKPPSNRNFYDIYKSSMSNVFILKTVSFIFLI